MAVLFEAESGVTRILDPHSELTPPTKTTLRLKGFVRTTNGFAVDHDRAGDQLAFALSLLRDIGTDVELKKSAAEIIRRRVQVANSLTHSQARGYAIKEGLIDYPIVEQFIRFEKEGLSRRLLTHQLKAAIHMLALDHTANFSVPGAGKTSVVLAVYEFLRRSGTVNFLFVVGPRSCFMAWSTEFGLTLGRQPLVQVVAGGDVGERRQRYLRLPGRDVELYLTTYQTLARDQAQAKQLLRDRASRAFYVIDEAHYVKQDEGIWAKAIAETSREATKRCALTGTPFPKSYADGINLFEILYPNAAIFPDSTGSRIRRASDIGDHATARRLLEPAIDSLYYRVRKQELNLSVPVFLAPVRVKMNPIERELYDCIAKRISELETEPSDEDLDTIVRLRRGRHIRRRQATSYPALLLSAISEYDEELVDPNDKLLNAKILNYDKLETPAKMTRLVGEVAMLNRRGEKVVIWANFVGTLHKIKEELADAGFDSRVIFGGTPTDSSVDHDTRDAIIERFKDAFSGLDILVANPAACAESVSLHRTCSYAIYYDLSYNCAQYLQSLDRIHRVGGSEEKTSFYLFLQYDETFEHEILNNLSQKATRMADVIDQEFPLALGELTDLGFRDEDFIE